MIKTKRRSAAIGRKSFGTGLNSQAVCHQREHLALMLALLTRPRVPSCLAGLGLRGRVPL
jgi:hypothetical protein